MVRHKRGISFAELLVIVLLIGAFTAVAIPRMNFALISKQKADYHARKIVTDLRRARSLAITNAASNTAGYGISMTGAGPYTGYEIVDLDTSTTIDHGTFTIDSDVTCNGGSQFDFGPLGNLKAGSDTQLTVSANGKTFTIDIISATGIAKCTEN